MSDQLLDGEMPAAYVEKVNSFHESILNHTDHGLCAYADQPCALKQAYPFGADQWFGERLGTHIAFGCQFDTRDLVLAEYLGTVVGLEISTTGKTIEERGRERLVVQIMRALSYSVDK